MNENKVMQVLLDPLVSEKSMGMNSLNQYAFKVATEANKTDVKSAVEQLFKVKVDAVRIVNSKPKSVRHGKIQGKQKAWKKAYVRLASGHAIDFIGAQA